MRRWWLCGGLLLHVLLFVNTLSAQVNVESMREPRESEGVVGEFGLSGEFQRGNVDLSMFGSSLRLDYLAPERHIFGVGTYNLGRVRGEAVQNNGFAHVRWVEMRGRVGFEIFTQAEQDLFKDLEVRQLNGGYFRIATGDRQHMVSSGVGVMSDFEKLSNGDQSILARATSYVNYTFKGRILSVGSVVYIQPALMNISDFRVLGTCALEVKLSKRFALQESFVLVYDTAPPSGVQVYDRLSKTALKLTW